MFNNQTNMLQTIPQITIISQIPLKAIKQMCQPLCRNLQLTLVLTMILNISLEIFLTVPHFK